MKKEELRNENCEQLKVMVETLRDEIFELRSQLRDNKSQKTHLIREKRREVARIKTLVKEKEMEKGS